MIENIIDFQIMDIDEGRENGNIASSMVVEHTC
jgi:hypothetical protein